MSLISGSYSRLAWTGGAALLSAAMVEKEDVGVIREVRIEQGAAARAAIGLIALLTTPDRERRFREAVLHKVRLKADIMVN